MLTRIHVSGDPDEINDRVNGNMESFPYEWDVKKPRLVGDSTESDPYLFEFHGRRILEMPIGLLGLEISKVVMVHQASTARIINVSPAGRYEAKEAWAYVEHSVPAYQNPTAGNVQYITVTGKTLEAANRLMDAIISGGVQPVTVTVPEPVPTFGERVKVFLSGFGLRREPFAG